MARRRCELELLDEPCPELLEELLEELVEEDWLEDPCAVVPESDDVEVAPSNVYEPRDEYIE